MKEEKNMGKPVKVKKEISSDIQNMALPSPLLAQTYPEISDKVPVLFTRPEDGYLYAQRQLMLTPPWTDGEPVHIEKETQIKDNGEEETVERKYLVYTDTLRYSTYGLLPQASDWLVLMCVLKEFQQEIESGRIPRKIKTSFAKILDACEYAKNGHNYNMVYESLAHKWCNIQVATFKYDSENGPGWDYSKLMSVTLYKRSIEIELDPKWLQKFGQTITGDMKLINFHHRTAIKTSKSRRFLDFVDACIEDKEGIVELPALKWREYLKFKTKFPSQIYLRISESVTYINREIPGLGLAVDQPEGPNHIIRVTMGCRKEKVPDKPPRAFLKLIEELDSEELKSSKKAVQMIYNRWLHDETKAVLEANMAVALMNTAEKEDRSQRLAEGIIGLLIAGKDYDWLADCMIYSIERKHAKRKKPLEDFEVYFFKIVRDGDLTSWRAKRDKAEAAKKEQEKEIKSEKTKEERNSQYQAFVRDSYSDELDRYIESVPKDVLIAKEQSLTYSPAEKKAMTLLNEEQKNAIKQAKIRSLLERDMLLEYDKTLNYNRDDIIRKAQIFMKPQDASFLDIDINNATPFHLKHVTDELFINWLRAAYMYQYCQQDNNDLGD